MEVKRILKAIAVYTGFGIILLFIMIPLYFVVINSFKPFREIVTSFIDWPKSFYLDNYPEAWKRAGYLNAFINSFTITTGSILGIIITSSMAAYKLARIKTKWSFAFYIYFIFSLTIPFGVIMIPMTIIANAMQINRSLIGICVVYWGLGSSFSIFLYHGFIKGIPLDIEESAQIDGCGPFRLFYVIVFPLLKPITSTVAVLQVLYIWNDFMLPLILTGTRKELNTLPLAQYRFYGEFNAEWNYALAAVVIGTIPLFIFFLLMQKFIVKGIVEGAVKG